MFLLQWNSMALLMAAAFMLSTICSLLTLSRPALCCMITGVLCNLYLFAEQYLSAWPMVPMHLGLVGVCAIVGIANILFWRRRERHLLLFLLFSLALLHLFFPKDFYLPFIRSYSCWAHLFLLAGIASRAMFLLATGGVLSIWLSARSGDAVQYGMRYLVFGYFLLTLSMFCGEIWSYLGWGTPVVWQDAAITTVIALWFYWSCFLHLHYIRGWREERRTIFLLIGGVLTLICTILPDAGPCRWL